MLQYLAIKGEMNIMSISKMKITSAGLMLMSALVLTSCGNETHEDTVDFSSEKEVKDKRDTKTNDEKFETHDHLIVDMGKYTYIIRECDENFSNVKVYENYGSIAYDVYDTEGNLLLDARDYGNPQHYVVHDSEQEKEINAIEEKAIENGAILYRGLTK